MPKSRISAYPSQSLEYQREWQKNKRALNPELIQGYKLKNSFGITLEQYNEILVIQNDVCAICKIKENAIDFRTKKVKKLAVDHCHVTNQIRGLLCSNCNQALGKFKDNIEFLLSAIEYLKKVQV